MLYQKHTVLIRFHIFVFIREVIQTGQSRDTGDIKKNISREHVPIKICTSKMPIVDLF
jgi:hypothetical protein